MTLSERAEKIAETFEALHGFRVGWLTDRIESELKAAVMEERASGREAKAYEDRLAWGKAEAFEKAAQVAEKFNAESQAQARICAKAIRALKTKEHID